MKLKWPLFSERTRDWLIAVSWFGLLIQAWRHDDHIWMTWATFAVTTRVDFAIKGRPR